MEFEELAWIIRECIVFEAERLVYETQKKQLGLNNIQPLL